MRIRISRRCSAASLRSAAGACSGSPLADLRRLVEEVEGSYLFVQGPPGAGKTWTGARLITHLIACGKRVGVASQSHKAIHNLLEEVVEAARGEGVSLSALKKASGDNEESYYRGPGAAPEEEAPSNSLLQGQVVQNETDALAFVDAPQRLFAGTGWLFAREELDGALDYLFVDEAGQISLADALALGTAARTLVLLGDPIQLAQVTQGIPPRGLGRVRARAPARRARDRARGHGPLPRALLPDAP